MRFGSSALTDSSRTSLLAQYFRKSRSENTNDYNLSNDPFRMEPTVWFHKEEIYTELCTLPAAYNVIPNQVVLLLRTLSGRLLSQFPTLSSVYLMPVV